jgi:hypothetical protein
MSRTIVIRYQTRTEAADENQRLAENVLAELGARQPAGLRYMVLRLADGVSFVHIAVTEGETSPLERSPAFAAFRQGIGNRLAGPVESNHAQSVGAYQFQA